MVKIVARLENGELMEYNDNAALLSKVRKLQAQGLTGKRLIHEAFTDDWGAPLLVVDLYEDNKLVERIRYD